MLFSCLYRLLGWIAPPIIRYYLRRRGRKNPDYLLHWDERFGKPYPQPIQHPIWIHAVSVGETRAAQPIIVQLQHHFPHVPLLITQMTPTGRATAKMLYPNAQCRYLPYDRVDWIQQFLQEHQPICGIIMETEIWVNLFAHAHARQIPLFLANARLSEKSLRAYQKILALIRPALNHLTLIFAQTEQDAHRFAQLGAKHMQVCGNSKYDITPPLASTQLAQYFRQKIGSRPVFVAASLREKDGIDEAEQILQAWATQNHRDILLVLIPRHPERFNDAYRLAQQYGFTVQKRSDNQPVLADTEVWIGDSMGEMFAYYQLANWVFVGGSLVDTGGQNIIEPMACGKTVLFGFSIYNFQTICQDALASKAAVQVSHSSELVQTINAWYHQPEDAQIYADKAQQFVEQHRGASMRITQAIADYLH